MPGQVNEYLIRSSRSGTSSGPGTGSEIKIHTPPAREQLWSYGPSNFAGVNKIHHDSNAPSSILLPVAPVPASLRPDSPNCGSLINVRCMDGNSSLGGGPGGGGGDYQDPAPSPPARRAKHADAAAKHADAAAKHADAAAKHADAAGSAALPLCEAALALQTIRVVHPCQDRTWWAESPDVAQWTVGGDSFDECRQLAEEGVRFARERGDLVVEHYLPAPS